jgi:hypothetical protein
MRLRPTSDARQEVDEAEDEGEARGGDPDGGQVEHHRFSLR